MQLASWNVNSLKVRLPRVEQFLAEHRPDVLCVQETKVAPTAFPHRELAAMGYHAVDHSAGRWGGVAIVARSGLALTGAVQGLPGEPWSEEARWVEAEVDGIRFASVYVPNGRAVGSEQFAGKLAFLDAMRAHLAGLAAGPLVVAGDFNVARTDLDVYDPGAFTGSTHVTPDERSRVQAVLDLGLVDAYRRLEPGAPGFTWWDYRAGAFHRNLGLRIDLVLLSAEPASRLVGCGIDRDYRKGSKPSDHAPLLVDLTG